VAGACGAQVIAAVTFFGRILRSRESLCARRNRLRPNQPTQRSCLRNWCAALSCVSLQEHRWPQRRRGTSVERATQGDDW